MIGLILNFDSDKTDCMKISLSFLILFSGLIFISCIPQTRDNANESKEYVISNNISNQQITSFAEDAFGHIWISTIRGLNKYSIHEYHQYFNSNDTFSISDNRIQSLYKDSHNRLWIATVNGISLYNDRDCFDRIPIEGSSPNAINLFENNDGRLFLNMNVHICAFNPEKKRFEVVIDDLEKNNFIARCHIDKSNNLWVVTPNDIRCYNSTTCQLKQQIKPFRYITFSYLDSNGNLWLASYNQIRIINTRSGQYTTVPAVISNHKRLSNTIITKMHPYNNSSLLINTQKDGLFLYNYISGTIVHQSESGFPFEAPNFEITTFFTDSQKNLWIGSYDQSFVVKYFYKERFNNDNFLRLKFENKSVLSVTPDHNNNLWIATRSDGLFVYKTNKQLFRIDTDRLFPENKAAFQHKIKRVFVDSDNTLWLVCDWMLLHCTFDGEKLTTINFFGFQYGIISITQDHQGNIWLGGMNENIYVLRKGSGQFKSIPLYGKEFNFTSAITTLSSGNILAASFDKELQLIDPITEEPTPVDIKSKIKRSKFIPSVLYEDSNGDIWIGTITNGLFCYSPKNNRIESYEGMSCSDVSSITEDAQGNLWVGTLYGLSKFDRTTKHFINYYETDGIGGNQFNEQSVCRLSDNSLLFGGTHGITSFNPIDVPYNRTIPLLFENLMIHNQIEKPSKSKSIDKHLAYNPKIRLKYYQNSFTISFAALDYCEFERVRYFYKLEGFDKIWIDAHNNREAYYSNLPAGKYTFKVKITNYDTTITEAENEIVVKIATAPWFSWPAIILYLIVFELILTLLIRTQRRIKANKEMAIKAELEKEQEQRVNKMNMSFFANMSHEFRTPLTLISGPIATLCNDESIKGEKKQLLYIVQRSVNRMLRLINQLMDFNKLENDTLKLKVMPVDIIGELNRPIDIFRLNAKEKGIELNTFGLEDNFIMWLDSDKLEKITANLLSNALKFSSPGGKIDISFDVITREDAMELFPLNSNDRDEQYAKVSIADTGKGIPEDKLEKIFERYFQLNNQTKEFYNWGTGIGLYYSRCLTELHHGHIKAENRAQGGAVFSFILPVSESSYSEEERRPENGDQQSRYPSQKLNKFDFPENDRKTDQKYKLMIIDDDSEVAHYLKTLLVPHYNVVYKFDADTAYKSIKEVEPDLILCDVVMPGTDGFTFCRQVKENLSFCHIPVILLTAKATVESQVEGLDTGADAYVTKPFDPSYLLALINSQLKNREKVRSLLGSTTKTETIEENILSPHDTTFMTNLYRLMENELSNTELNITRMTEVLKISRTKFYYKVKGLTGENPNVFFKTYKLNRAAELLLEGEHNISEIADMTGFSTLSHFSVSFKKQFGVSPSDYNGDSKNK